MGLPEEDAALTGSIDAHRGMTISDMTRRHARARPTALAMSDHRGTRTYGELHERSAALGAALASIGIHPGDRVGVMGHNCIELFETHVAASSIGAVCVTLNFRLAAAELGYILLDSSPKVVVVTPQFEVAVRSAIKRSGLGCDVWVVGSDIEARLTGAPAAAGAAWVDDESNALIMYTSGTTGRPKGAVLTHRSIYLQAFSKLVHMGMGPDDAVSLTGTPLFHIGGFSSLIPPLIAGRRSVIARTGSFDPHEVLALIAREGVTSCSFVPSQWAAICSVETIGEYDLSSLRRVAWGAAPATPTLLAAIRKLLPEAEVQSAFGQTECSSATAVLVGEAAISRPDSVGRPLINVDARVVDADENDVEVGEIGEILYRGPMIMKEYWNLPAETAEAFRNGWFHSGDLVRQDAEGYLYVVGRKKDMIISGGENIYPAEIEVVLGAHPAIADVAVVGVPDERWGESALAVVVLRDGNPPPSPDDLIAFCRSSLAGYKVPRRFEIVAELPRNASGKIVKRELRATFQQPPATPIA